MPARREAILGCLLGGALGDAFGAPLEGRAGPLEVDLTRAGLVTDDTQLTMATCEAIIERGDVHPESIARRFLHWFKNRRLTGIGSSTLKALRDLDAGGHWALAGAGGDLAAGNGAAMRVAPLAFLLDPEREADRLLIGDVCRITHHNEEAYAGALAIVIAVRLAMLQDRPPGGLPLSSLVADRLPDSAVRDRLVRLSALADHPASVAASFGASGYVVDSVPLAIYSAQAIAGLPFETVLARALGAGGDTDTIGAMTGQIAGAFAGRSGLPESLLAGLQDLDWIVEISERFATAVSGSRGSG